MGRVIKADEPVLLTAKSFDEKHEIQFNEGSHRYKLDGKQTVGVTTFTKAGYKTSMGLITWMREETAKWLLDQITVPGKQGLLPREGYWPIPEDRRLDLIKTAKRVDRGTAQLAADIGTICHGYAELHSLGKFDEAEDLLKQVRGAEAWPLIETCVAKYKEWAKTNQGQLIQAEALVGSPTYMYCGKIDRLDQVNGKFRLRDYKTSKDIFLEQFIQLGAYAIAIKEWLGITVEELEVLRFGKDDGTFDTLLINEPREIKMLQDQAIRCRYTYEFIKMENDPRFKWGA